MDTVCWFLSRGPATEMPGSGSTGQGHLETTQLPLADLNFQTEWLGSIAEQQARGPRNHHGTGILGSGLLARRRGGAERWSRFMPNRGPLLCHHPRPSRRKHTP